MNKGQFSNILRKMKLIYFTDLLRYQYFRIKNRRANKDFKKKNPIVILPPDYLMYESFQINYYKYYEESKHTSKWVVDYLSKYISINNVRILDWGCGPGRVIRHMPLYMTGDSEFYGTDYNIQSIEWCKTAFPNIKFNHNQLEAKLPYPDNFFDAIYGISIFTHLSEQLHYEWRDELLRVLKPEGVLFLTTHGDNFKSKLSPDELLRYNRGNIIVRGSVKEGHRTFCTYHPTEFMNRLFQGLEVLEHDVLVPEKGKWLPQDVWIVRK